VSGLYTICTQSGLCQKAAGSNQGTCLGSASDTQACDIDAGPDCLPDAKCVPTSPSGTAGVCTEPAPASCP
jgi:hypothetical protein